MDDLVVDGGAQAAREPEVALERRLGALLVNERLSKLVQVPSRHAWSNGLLEFVQNLTDDTTRVAHDRNLVFALELYLAHRLTSLLARGLLPKPRLISV